MKQKLVINESEYQIMRAKIVKVKDLTPTEKFFEIVLADGSSLNTSSIRAMR